MRSSSTDTATDHDQEDEPFQPSHPVPRSITTVTAHQPVRTRRRKGSLRKVALLGRGAQRDRRDTSPLTIDTSPKPQLLVQPTTKTITSHDALGLTTSQLTPPPSVDAFPIHSALPNPSFSPTKGPDHHRETSTQSTGYNSTTDEEDILQISNSSSSIRPILSMSSVPAPASDSYFSNIGSAQRRRSFHQAKSPLSYSGLSTTPLPPPDLEWDYSETEWWGWVILTATWFIFVIGMGSCLDVWSWAWDVGKTPYAPPELEDDPTLPIVGYYPALIILTCIMAWVWVAVAWVGMKYFRHAKISGD